MYLPHHVKTGKVPISLDAAWRMDPFGAIVLNVVADVTYWFSFCPFASIEPEGLTVLGRLFVGLLLQPDEPQCILEDHLISCFSDEYLSRTQCYFPLSRSSLVCACSFLFS